MNIAGTHLYVGGVRKLLSIKENICEHSEQKGREKQASSEFCVRFASPILIGAKFKKLMGISFFWLNFAF